MEKLITDQQNYYIYVDWKVQEHLYQHSLITEYTQQLGYV